MGADWVRRRRRADQQHKCAWCGEQFYAARADALTCSSKCRQRLHWFRREAGFDPEEPQGTLTARQALDLLILTLLRRERDRLTRARSA